MSTATRPATGGAAHGAVSPLASSGVAGRPVAGRRAGRRTGAEAGCGAAGLAPTPSIVAREAVRWGNEDGLSAPGRRLKCWAFPTNPRPEVATRLERKTAATILPPACCDMPNHVPAKGVTWSGRNRLSRTVPPRFPSPSNDLNVRSTGKEGKIDSVGAIPSYPAGSAASPACRASGRFPLSPPPLSPLSPGFRYGRGA